MSKIFKDISVLSVITVLSRIGTLILFGLYSKYLSIEDFGIYSLSIFLVNVLLIVGTLGSLNTIEAKIFDAIEDGWLKDLVFSSFAISFFATGTVIIIGLIISLVLELDRNLSSSIFTLLFCRMIFSVIQRLFSAQKKVLSYTFYECLYLILNFSIIYYHISEEIEPYTIIFINCISYTPVIIMQLIDIRKLLNFRMNKKIIKSIINFSLPLFGHSAVNASLGIFDKFLITKFSGLYSTGIYNMAFQLGETQNMLTTAANRGIAPHQYENYNLHNNEKQDNTFYKILFGFSILGFLISIFLPIFLEIFSGTKYMNSFIPMSLVILGYTINLFYFINVPGIMKNTDFKNPSKQLFKISTISGLLSIAYISIGIFYFDAMGGAVGFVLSKITLTILTTYNSKSFSDSKFKILFWFLILNFFLTTINVSFHILSEFKLTKIIVTCCVAALSILIISKKNENFKKV